MPGTCLHRYWLSRSSKTYRALAADTRPFRRPHLPYLSSFGLKSKLFLSECPIYATAVGEVSRKGHRAAGRVYSLYEESLEGWPPPEFCLISRHDASAPRRFGLGLADVRSGPSP